MRGSPFVRARRNKKEGGRSATRETAARLSGGHAVRLGERKHGLGADWALEAASGAAGGGRRLRRTLRGVAGVDPAPNAFAVVGVGAIRGPLELGVGTGVVVERLEADAAELLGRGIVDVDEGSLGHLDLTFEVHQVQCGVDGARASRLGPALGGAAEEDPRRHGEGAQADRRPDDDQPSLSFVNSPLARASVFLRVAVRILVSLPRHAFGEDNLVVRGPNLEASLRLVRRERLVAAAAARSGGRWPRGDEDDDQHRRERPTVAARHASICSPR
mmetsp:Transcript_14794/g.46500  ORF Transcript_14794/g.46500 Transcript_14794/m.46500 type:complete len:274 (-) Transcript_14794:8-829(-)